ncbi:uncharacterized protein LOC144351337 [Saccoglossus kowalevskii]
MSTAPIPSLLAVTLSMMTCNLESCPDDLDCWNSTTGDIRIGWGYRDFGVCLSSKSCFGESNLSDEDDIDFSLQLKPITIQRGDRLIFYAIEDDFLLDPVLVSYDAFQECRPIGVSLSNNISKNGIYIDSMSLLPGVNYIIHKRRDNDLYACDFGLKLKVFVKYNHCRRRANAEDELQCNGHGHCASSKDEIYNTCHCCHGYTGIFCEAVVIDCNDNPCQNGGFCQNKFYGNDKCICSEDYTGPFCETMVSLTTESALGTTTLVDLNVIGVNATSRFHTTTSLPNDLMDLHWVQIQLFIPSLICQLWQSNATVKDEVYRYAYTLVRDKLIPSAVRYCTVGGANFGISSLYDVISCLNDGTVLRLRLASSKSSSVSTSELLCIMLYYMRNTSLSLEIYNASHVVSDSFPLPVYSVDGSNCWNEDTIAALCNQTNNGTLDLATLAPSTTKHLLPIKPVWKSVEHPAKNILIASIPVCSLLLLLFIAMAICIYLYKRKYTKSYTFKESIRLAKLKDKSGENNVRTTDVKVPANRWWIAYSRASSAESPNNGIASEPRQSVNGCPILIQEGESDITEYKPTTSSRSRTATINSNDTDLNQMSADSDMTCPGTPSGSVDDTVKIINVKPVTGEDSVHIYDNLSFMEEENDIEDILSL